MELKERSYWKTDLIAALIIIMSVSFIAGFWTALTDTCGYKSVFTKYNISYIAGCLAGNGTEK